MDDDARIQLQKLISETGAIDQTDLIRQLKHSQPLRREIDQLMTLKRIHANDPETLNMEAMGECHFLFRHYTDLYNKIRQDEIDMNLLNYFLSVLEKIENGELDQHNGSYLIGTALKKMYIDSAIKKSDKLDAAAASATTDAPKLAASNISYREWRQSRRGINQ